MIENIRKYTGLMTIVFVLLAAAFIFTMNDIGGSRGGGGGAQTVLKAHGRSLDQQEYNRMGSRTLELASAAGLHEYINLLLTSNINELQQAMSFSARFGANYYTVAKNNLTNKDVDRFVANRIIIQKAIDDMGLYASEDEVSDHIKELPSFAPGGKFDSSAYTQFMENGIGSLGMTEKDLREIVRESLCLQKLTNIIGGGLPQAASAVRSRFESQMQTVTFSRISFDLDDFIKKEQPTEEEVKAYWESHQDAYKSDETRRINYSILDVPTQEKTPETKLADNASDEEKAAKETADKLAAAKKAEKRAADINGLKREINEISQTFYDHIDEKQPLEFEKTFTEKGKTVVKTELFSQVKLPAELTKYNSLRGSHNQNSSLAAIIFQLSQSEDPYDLISDPLPVGENGWLIFTLEEIVEPTLLAYEEAKDKARTDFIKSNAQKQLKETAQDAQKLLTEAMSEGKDFDAVAKEQGYKVVQVGPYSAMGTPPKDEPSYRQLLQTASGLNPEDISEVIDEPNRSLFIKLTQRELEASEENENRIKDAVDNSDKDILYYTFFNWINDQYKDAQVKGLDR